MSQPKQTSLKLSLSRLALIVLLMAIPLVMPSYAQGQSDSESNARLGKKGNKPESPEAVLLSRLDWKLNFSKALDIIEAQQQALNAADELIVAKDTIIRTYEVRDKASSEHIQALKAELDVLNQLVAKYRQKDELSQGEIDRLNRELKKSKVGKIKSFGIGFAAGFTTATILKVFGVLF